MHISSARNTLLFIITVMFLFNSITFAAPIMDSQKSYKTSSAQGNLIIDKNNINTQKHKVSATLFNTEDKRQYLRFNTNKINKPVILKQNISSNIKLQNISRGGIAIQHKQNVKQGDILPIEIVYGKFNLRVNAQIISNSESLARAQFVDLDTETINKLLYLSILLEEDNNMLATRLR